jgi:hypothetical protein
MPNTPLQTFRTVEPANYAFGSSATMASRPFVVFHQFIDVTSPTADTRATVAFTAATHVNLTTKTIPWLIKDTDRVYPVAVPNAYDRIYIFPMYVAEQSAAKTAANYVNFGFSEASGGTYAPPIVIPFGRFPDTYGLTTTGKLDPAQHRIPDDIIGASPLSASGSSPLNTRANGLWTVLPPYATNFTTGNLNNITSTETLPSSVARIITGGQAGLVGNGYKLPADLTISSSLGAALGTTTTAGVGVSGYTPTGTPFQAGGTAFPSTQEGVVVGQGIEYQTMGTDLLVVSPQSLPTNLTYVPRGNPGNVRFHWFMMGVFLG